MAEPMTLWGLLGRILLHGQKFLVYPSGFEPRPRFVRNPEMENLDYELLQLPTPDGATIHCHLMFFSSYKSWRASANSKSRSSQRYSVVSTSGGGSAGRWDNVPENGRATVVMFHGNAMNHGDIIDLAEKFLWRGCNVITVSYRGYGESTGTPSESGLRTDAQTVLNYITQHEVLSSVPIVVWGQSLGAAVAIDLVHKNPQKVSALIIENGFLSIPLLVKDFPQPFSSLSFLCTQRWPSIERIQKIPKSISILMLGGDADQVIPPKHLQGLWAGSQSRPSALDSLTPPHTEPSGVTTENATPGTPPNLEPVAEKEVKRKASHRRLDSDSHFPGCFPSSPRKKYPTKSGSEILKTLEVVSGDVDRRNGKDRYRLFAYGRHETTCRHRQYWPTIGEFLDDVFGPCSTTQNAHPSSSKRASIIPLGSLSTKRDSLPPSTSYDVPTSSSEDAPVSLCAATITTPPSGSAGVAPSPSAGVTAPANGGVTASTSAGVNESPSADPTTSSGRETIAPSSSGAHDLKIAALAEAHVPLDLPPRPEPVTSPTFAPPPPSAT